MTQLRALAYADWRALRNDGRRILRSPGRLGAWIAYALLIGVLVWGRTFAGRRAGAAHTALASADYLVTALLITLVVGLATGRGAIGIFRSRVEARFIIGSPVAAPLAIAYLQTREALGQGVRFLFSVLYFILIVAPRGLGAATAFADVVLVVVVIAAGAAIVVPRRLLSERAGRLCLLAGIPLGLLALAPALRDIVVQGGVPPAFGAPILAVVPAWHPGRALLEPNVVCFAAVAMLAAAGIGTLAAAGRDVYPELYALAIARIERREQWRARRRRGRVAIPARAGHGAPFRIAPPSGVLAFVWKSAIEFGRVVRPAAIAAQIVAAFGGGFVVARLLQHFGFAFGLALSVGINWLLVVGVTAASALAAELRRPLFWLAPAALFERFAALAFAQIWRKLLTLELIAAGFACGGGGLPDSLAIAIGLPALVTLLAGVGFATFAWFPNPADQRGPVGALRFGIAALLLVPPVVLDGIGTLAFGAPVAALLAASLLAVIEAGALVGIAAWRFDGHVDRIPA